jgi:hypothetical protein
MVAAVLAGAAGRGAAFETYSDGDYAAVLMGFVDAEGMVDYASLKEQRDLLDAYVVTLEMMDPKVYEQWKRPDQVAFWINAYNALTLRAIIDHHPITPQPGREAFPKNSIRQIPGVWDHRPARVMGMKITLDHIEHKILRGDFQEPRIHMALVCAAVSCPPLRNEPYRGATLDAQLDDQARRFLSDLRRFHIDRAKNEVWASEIFKWFVDDFLPGATAADETHVAQRKSLAAFASKYVSEADRKFLAGTTYTVQYFKYDWTLNEQKH